MWSSETMGWTRKIAGPYCSETRDRFHPRIISWEPEKRSFWVAAGAAEDIRVRTFYYPHWVASAAGKLLPIRPANDGAILISIPSEVALVELEFREPRRTRVAAAVSMAGWGAIILLLLYGVWSFRNPRATASE